MSRRFLRLDSGWWIAGAGCALVLVFSTVAGIRHFRTRAAIKVIEDNGGRVMGKSVGPQWLRNVVGNRLVNRFNLTFGVDLMPNLRPGRRPIDQIFSRLPDLPQLHFVSLSSPLVVDDDLILIGRLSQLDWISLSETSITGAGLVHLQALPELRELYLSDTALLNDDGLRALSALTQLTDLTLDGAPITDESLERLKPLKNLRRLSLSNTGVSEYAIEQLREVIPNLEVTDD